MSKKNSDENNDTKNNETADISFKDEYFTKESTSFSLDIAKFCALANLKYHNNDNNFFTKYSFRAKKELFFAFLSGQIINRQCRTM